MFVSFVNISFYLIILMWSIFQTQAIYANNLILSLQLLKSNKSEQKFYSNSCLFEGIINTYTINLHIWKKLQSGATLKTSDTGRQPYVCKTECTVLTSTDWPGLANNMLFFLRQIGFDYKWVCLLNFVMTSAYVPSTKDSWEIFATSEFRQRKM